MSAFLFGWLGIVQLEHRVITYLQQTTVIPAFAGMTGHSKYDPL
jgi:hypothetical protein